MRFVTAQPDALATVVADLENLGPVLTAAQFATRGGTHQAVTARAAAIQQTFASVLSRSSGASAAAGAAAAC
jgi:hypothetical protein